MISPVLPTNDPPRRPSGPGGCGAFTLIELLLVLAILGVVSAVTVPSFVRSIRGNRLRAAARTVVMAGRYARSLAVLKQCDFEVTFDLAAGDVSVAEAPESDGEGEDEAELQPAIATTAFEPGSGATGAVVRAADPWAPSRRLDRVAIAYVDVEGAGSPVREGTCRVTYRNNGRCTPYTVKIVDEWGSGVVVSVDALSSAQTEREDGEPL